MEADRFPLKKEKDFKGMVISLPGVLDRAAEQCKRSRDSKHLEWPLRQLITHINYIRASESDEQALQRMEEFLRLWVD